MNTSVKHAVVHSRTQQGINAPLVSIEVYYFPDATNDAVEFTFAVEPDLQRPDISSPDQLFSASRTLRWPSDLAKSTVLRLVEALQSGGFEIPRGMFVVQVNDTCWHGSGRFDLAMCLAMLGASGQVPLDSLRDCDVYGAVTERGEICAPRDSLLVAISHGTVVELRTAVIPARSSEDCLLAAKGLVSGYSTLRELCDWLRTRNPLPVKVERQSPQMDMTYLQAPEIVREAVVIAAAGGHSMVVRDACLGVCASVIGLCLTAILPPLDYLAACEQTHLSALSVQGQQRSSSLWGQPFCSVVGPSTPERELFGEGPVHIGAISVARHGVLVLQQPQSFATERLERMEHAWKKGRIFLPSVDGEIRLPVATQWILAMPACPQGEALNTRGRCSCKPQKHAAALAHIPPGLLENCALELQFGYEPLRIEQRWSARPDHRNYGELEVQSARGRQRERNRQFKANEEPGCLNGELSTNHLLELMAENVDVLEALRAARQRHQWSQAKTNAVFAVTLTVRDLKGNEALQAADVEYAVSLCDGSRVIKL